MKKNELFSSVAFFVLILSFLSAATSNAQSKSTKQENLIVGEWFPLSISNGGLGMGFTFTDDGKVSSTIGAYIVFKYRLEGDTLTFIFPDDTPEIKHKVEINSTKLIFINKDANTELTRISGENNSGIIGKWTGDHHTGKKQIIYFTLSQNIYLSVPMTSEQATYKINGNIVELFGNINSSYQWSIEGDNLTLKGTASEKSLKYVRMK